MAHLLYVCLDGLGDDPLEELDGRTPLEAAETPALDGLAARGRSGTVVTVGPDVAPESDIAVFAILGYDPTEEHPGRGVVEAIGVDLPFTTGDLAYRVNFATAAWPDIIDRRVGRDLRSEEAAALADEVNRELRLPDATFELRATVEHRGVLVIRSAEGSLSANVSNTDPAYRKEGSLGVALERFEPRVASCVPLDATREARRSADLTNAFVEGAARILDASEVNRRRRAAGSMPGNVILTRDAGDTRPTLQSIRERFGLAWGCFVEMPVERGIARVLGMDEVDVPRLASASDYAVWAERAAEAVREYEAVYVHLKGPDVPAHDGRGADKRDVISLIDRAFFSEVLPRLDPRGTVVAVTADHSTSCARKAHTADPVPLVVAGAGVPPDGCEGFGERAAASGALGRLRGVDILPGVVPLLA